jgi:hypothetical protein
MIATPIRPRLAAVWIVLAVLVGVVAAIEYGDHKSEGGGDERSADALLPVGLKDLDAVEIGQAGTMHRFERDHDGAWFYHGVHGSAEAPHDHHADPAKADVIAKALAGFARARIERRLPAGGAGYGLAAPRMLILIYRHDESRPFAQYAVGDVAPDSFSRYVQKLGNAEAVTIANYQIENLVKLIEAMRN